MQHCLQQMLSFSSGSKAPSQCFQNNLDNRPKSLWWLHWEPACLSRQVQGLVMLKIETSWADLYKKKEKKEPRSKSVESVLNLVHRCVKKWPQGVMYIVQGKVWNWAIGYIHPASFNWMHYSTVTCTEEFYLWRRLFGCVGAWNWGINLPQSWC